MTKAKPLDIDLGFDNMTGCVVVRLADSEVTIGSLSRQQSVDLAMAVFAWEGRRARMKEARRKTKPRT